MPEPSTPEDGISNNFNNIGRIHYISAWIKAVPYYAKPLFHNIRKTIIKIKCKSCTRQSTECVECEYEMIMEYAKAVHKYYKSSRNRRECPLSVHNRFVKEISYQALAIFIGETFPSSDKAKYKLLDFEHQILLGYSLNPWWYDNLTAYPSELKERKMLLRTLFIIEHW